MSMEPRRIMSIEAFRKSKNGRFYRIVRFRVNGTLVEVGEFLADNNEDAVKKAAKALEEAMICINENSSNNGERL